MKLCTVIFAFLLSLSLASAQDAHGPNLVIRGSFFVDNGAVVTVQGDLHLKDDNGSLINDGHFEVEGHIYKDSTSQYGGIATGRMVLRNDQVNQGQEQAIYGAFTGSNAFRQLEIDNQGIIPNVKLMNGDLEVSKSLILTQGAISSVVAFGNSTSPAYKVIVSSGNQNSITGNFQDNFITTKLRRHLNEETNYTFPVGVMTADYSGPMPVNVWFGDAPAYFEVEPDMSDYFSDQDPPVCDVGDSNTLTMSPDGVLDVVYLDCTVGGWTVNKSPGGEAMSLTFSPLQDLLNACGSPFYYLIKNGSLLSNCPTTSFTTSQLSSLNSFKIVGASSWSTTELPIELLNFRAEGLAHSVLLKWQTATEINSDGFEIQKSTDGIDFETIHWVTGQGHSSSTINYSYEDEAVSKNTIYYYRLKMVDLDGSVEFSEVRTALLGEALQFSEAKVYPNPIDPATQELTYTALDTGPVNIELINTLGEIVFSYGNDVTEGFNSLVLPDIATGTYYLIIRDEIYTRRATLLVSP